MRKINKKIVAIALCAALCVGGISSVFAVTENKQENKEAVADEKQESQAQNEVFKDETVYVLTGADGSVQKIIVSDWIKNSLRDGQIYDKSELSNIENVNGNESYTMNADNMKVWDSQGNDIYYQGNIDKELPVDLAVTYTLDGKKVSAEEIVGKSGKISIRFDYTNRQYKLVEVNGKEEKIYVPFAILTGVLLDSDTFRNVEVSNGKLINDGNNTAVVGIAFPGLQDNIGIDSSKIEIPDYVEITADVTDFELGMTVTIANNDIFSKLDSEKLDEADGLKSSISQLTDGISQLAEGAAVIKSGSASLDEGAASLKSGISELYTGLNAISANSTTLNSGAVQVFETLLSSATTQIKAAGISIPDLTIENYTEVINGILNIVGEQSAAGMSINGLKASLDSYNTFYRGLNAYTEGVDKAAAGSAALNKGANELKEGTARLMTGADTLYNGILKLKEGVSVLTNEDIAGITARLKATIEVSQGYNNFSGINSDMDGKVSFIYRTDEISK